MWQDQEAFDQRCDQNHADRERNICDQIAKPTFDKRQRREGDDGCDGRGKHRQRHPAGGVFCCRFWIFAQAFGPEIGVLAHNDGIIHHDPKGDQHGKHRDHVQRNAHHPHKEDSCKHRHRNACSHPEGCPRIQEQEQQTYHQRQASQAILDKDVETVFDGVSTRPDQVNLNTLGRR